MPDARGAGSLVGTVMPRTRLMVWVLAMAVSVTGLVLSFNVEYQRRPTLASQGRPLEFWFNQLPMTRNNGGTVGQSRHMLMRSPSGAVRKYGDWTETPEASARAIRDIGTNALTFYLGKLTRNSGVIEQTIAKAARAVGYRGFLFADAYPERGQAVTALILLKPLPSGVTSNLVTLSTSSNREISAAAHCALATTENELVTLHSPARKQSLDLNLLNLPNFSDFK
jgi:hypothetical protein